ncbi:Uncharacterised protein [Starkeya nomas]|uniref:Uncharacterized protein n=1 Tax=Starkeya nomas TaxID=2666134 RepID=A0A5S9R5R3_9HYPH|nr:DNA transposition protein [Starkeya nomas]CAA0128956.1 Uncharacterised protein [Starkeya nomas]
MSRRDPHTLDLFDWTPPTVVKRFDERRVRAATWRDQVARAVAETLGASELSRDEIADRMNDFLGEDEGVSRAMLDNYASQAKETHTISYMRVIALCAVTGDARLLQLAADPIERIVIEARFEGAIQEAMAAEQIEQLERIKKLGRRQWRGRA